ncbi:hypothetical protein FB451DRAFT_241751 [Mycena latifolia]|nr:hypothetical protein FB451DRAFT_241751 [Mycena latifolia]
MHSSLSLHALSGLPVALRRVAHAAANGSIDDLCVLCDRIDDVPPSQSRLFLPAFYANLDPKHIPSPSETLVLPDSVARAIEALDGLYAMKAQIPLAAFPSIWPRYWKWTEFIHTFMGSRIEFYSETDYCLEFLQFLARFQEEEEIENLVGATPGVRHLLARTWVLLLDVEDLHAREGGFVELFSWVIGALSPSDTTHFDEFVDGAGGTIHDLASVITRNISIFVPMRGTTLSEMVVHSLNVLFIFVASADRLYEKDGDPGPQLLRKVLCSQGGGILPIAACALSDTEFPITFSAVITCFRLIGQALEDPRGYLFLAKAIKHGLLYALVSSTLRGYRDNVIPDSMSLLNAMLPFTIYYTVLEAIIVALPEVDSIVRTEAFDKTPFFGTWRKFIAVVRPRFQLIRRFNSPEYAPPRACDNVVCGVIQENSLFKRCAGCRSVYYCSRPCQIADWYNGDHKKTCSPWRALCINEHQPMSWRDRVFLRMLIHHDYEAARSPEIYVRQIMFMKLFPGDAFLTVFNYTSGRPVISVDSVVDSDVGRELQRYGGAEWQSAVERAARSGGRIELHVMVVADGPGTRIRHWLLPMRSANTAVHDALRRLEGELPPLDRMEQAQIVQVLMEKVGAFLHDHTAPLAIH